MQLPPTTEDSMEKNANFTKLKTPKSGFSRSFHWITALFKSRIRLWWSVIGIHAEDLGGPRLNEFGRCWRWLVGRQSAWQKESCGAFTWLEKKRTVPQRGIWMRKHLLLGQTQICFPLESMEICSKSCFERDPVRLYICSSIKVKRIWELSSSPSHQATDTQTCNYNKDNLSITGLLLLLFTWDAKSSSS